MNSRLTFGACVSIGSAYKVLPVMHVIKLPFQLVHLGTENYLGLVGTWGCEAGDEAGLGVGCREMGGKLSESAVRSPLGNRQQRILHQTERQTLSQYRHR